MRVLKGAGIETSTDASEVFFCRGEDGLLACVALPGKGGGAFYLSAAAAAEGPAVFMKLLTALGTTTTDCRTRPITLKLAGPLALRQQLRGWLEQQGIAVTSEAEATAFEAFFHPGSGRLRLAREAASGPARGPIRVLIVDDSATIRKLLRQVLEADPQIEVVAEAERPSQVEALIARHRPQVITLDINLPEMDGVTLLERYLPRHPIPTVMVTALSMQESDQVLRALQLGAVDYLQKPSLAELSSMSEVIREKIRTAAGATLSVARGSGHVRGATAGMLAMVDPSSLDLSTVIAIGSSTGGVQALEAVFTRLPARIPPIVVVQHIPAVFSTALARRLNDLCPFEVREAAHGDEVRENRVLIAPGGMQLKLEKRGQELRVSVFDGAPVNRHKPSVDVLFDSAAGLLGNRAVGVILTGMGADGAKGLLRMKEAGARTIAQDKDSCVVFGMPREAIALGAAEKICPLAEIPGAILGCLARTQRRGA